MNQLVVFSLVSIPLMVLSRKSIFNPRSHGFFRLLGWECIAWLLSSNYKFWVTNPFGLKQMTSWFLLLLSLYYVIAGLARLQISGKPEKSTSRDFLFRFERTTVLVTSGIFSLVRHPMYGSLIFLSWGIFLKNANAVLLSVTIACTFFLYLTALRDEQECLDYFGNSYLEYRKKTKMFVPFLW